MPAEITQKLGFDAAQAVKTLADLRSRLNEFKQSLTNAANSARQFNTKMRPVVATLRELRGASSQAKTSLATVGTSMRTASQATAQAGQGMQKAGTQVQKGATQAGTAVTRMGKQMQTTGKQGAQAGKILTLSWKTVARIVQAQLIIRGLSALSQAFKQTIVDAKDFQLAIGEIKAIAPAILGSQEKITQSVLELSATLSRTAAEVAEGMYQVLSNQVVEAADAVDFLRQAEQLAVVTHAETRDAVNALSSVMNSYSMSMEETERVAGTLFKTVELGRLRLNEFADILGRVTPLTAKLGIEWEEVAASLATMTRQGVKVNTAITQLRAIVLKLIKPTEKMRDLFKQWGVRDAKQAIAKFGGLIGLLKEMAKETGDNSQEMAEYFNRVRAIAGQMGIMVDDGKEVTETLGEIREATKSSTEAFEEYSKLPAFEIEKNLTAIQNKFIELGIEALPVLADIVKNLNDAIPAGKKMWQTLKTIGSALKVIATTAALAAAAVAAVMAPWVLAAAAAGYIAKITVELLLLEKTVKSTGKTFDDLVENWKTQDKELAQNFSKMRESITQKDKEEFDAMQQNAWTWISEMNIVWDRLVTIADARIDALGDHLSGMFESSIKSFENSLNKIKSVQDNFNKYMQRSNDRLADMAQGRHDREYKLSLDVANVQKRNRLILEEAEYRLAQAREKFAKVGISEEKQRHALEMNNSAKELAFQQLQEAVKSGDRRAESKWRRQLTKAEKQERDAETKFQNEVKKLNTEEAKEARRIMDLKTKQLRNTFAETKEVFEKLARIEDQNSKEATELRQKLFKLETEAFEAFFDKPGMQMSALLGIDDAMNTFSAQLLTTMESAHFDWEREIQKLQALFNKTVFKLQTDFGDPTAAGKAAAEFLGRARMPTEVPGQFIGEAFKQATKYATDFKGAQVDINDHTIRINKSLERMNETASQFTMDEFLGGLETGTAKISGVLAKVISLGKMTNLEARMLKRYLGADEVAALKLRNAMLKTMEAAKQGEHISKSTHEGYLDQLKTLKDTGNVEDTIIQKLESMMEQLSRGLDSAKEKQTLLEDFKTEKFETAEKLIKTVKKESDGWGTKTKEIETAIEGINKGTVNEADAIKLLFDPTETVKTTLEGQATAIDDSVAKTNELTRAEKTYQTELVKRPTPGAPGAPTEPTAPTVPDVAPTMETMNQLTERMDTSITNLNDKFITIKTSVDEVVLRTMDISTSISDAVQQTGMLMEGFGAVDESIAANYLRVNNLINVILDAARATGKVQIAMNDLGGAIQADVRLANSLESAMRRVEAAAKAAASAIRAAASAGGGMYKGGPVNYLQGGGQARGNDTIPAMLSPGEFVVNARSTRRFFSQLQAMNAGQSPIYRDQGGSVTNVGDIHVSVTQGETSRQSAREMATALRREIKRKTSRIN